MNSNYNPFQSPAGNDLDPNPMSSPGAGQHQRHHSGLGIASFIISLASACLMFLLFVVAGYIELSTQRGMDVAISISLALFALLFLSLIGLVLRIAVLFQKGQKKLFGVLGILFSGATIGGTILLVIIGLMLE
jgi:hypothetical protein